MSTRPLVVWGNCQARPLAALLRVPLAAIGIDVVELPPVYLITAAELAQVRQLIARSAALVAQPVRDDYRVPGCGTHQLAQLLPPDAPSITFPVLHDTTAFPYQVRAVDGHDVRVDAPLTDYHDLRVLLAARRGLTTAQTMAWWPAPDPAAVRANRDHARAELRRRGEELTVTAPGSLDAPDAMWTMTHPANTVLADVARAVLHELGGDGVITVPDVEFLAQRRTPLEPAVAAALGWPASAVRPDWRIDGADVALAQIVDTHLAYYAQHPDVVARTLDRAQARLDLLGLTRTRVTPLRP